MCDMQLLAYLAVLQPDVSWYLISICWIILQLNPGNHQIQSLWISSCNLVSLSDLTIVSIEKKHSL